jgi:hypothetical protein
MPLPALATKFLIGEAMDRMGANKDLKGFVMGPKAFMVDKLKGAVDSAAGLRPGTTNFLTDPKGVMLDTAKDYAKDKIKESLSTQKPEPSFTPQDFIPFESKADYDMPAMEYEGDYKRGGKVKRKIAFKPTTKVNSTSRRGDGIAQRGKTRGRYV